MLPGFVIIGAQKAATTLVHEMLSAHAGVFMPNMEVPFFEDPDYGGAAISSLSGLFDRAGQNALCGIRRPNYLVKPECPERLSRGLSRAGPGRRARVRLDAEN